MRRGQTSGRLRQAQHDAGADQPSEPAQGVVEPAVPGRRVELHDAEGEVVRGVQRDARPQRTGPDPHGRQAGGSRAGEEDLQGDAGGRRSQQQVNRVGERKAARTA
jgi:hypothetical protein